jgi:hypothetical protein
MSDRTIWKFPLSIGAINTFSLPASAMVRMAALDPASERPAIWVELNPEATRIERRFVIFGTGHHIEGDGGYPYDLHVGSLIDGSFVWHIFERRT